MGREDNRVLIHIYIKNDGPVNEGGKKTSERGNSFQFYVFFVFFLGRERPTAPQKKQQISRFPMFSFLTRCHNCNVKASAATSIYLHHLSSSLSFPVHPALSSLTVICGLMQHHLFFTHLHFRASAASLGFALWRLALNQLVWAATSRSFGFFSICEVFVPVSGVIFSGRSASLVITACANSPVTLLFLPPNKRLLLPQEMWPSIFVPEVISLGRPTRHPSASLIRCTIWKGPLGTADICLVFSRRSCCWHVASNWRIPEETQACWNYHTFIKRLVPCLPPQFGILQVMGKESGWLRLSWPTTPENLLSAVSLLARFSRLKSVFERTFGSRLDAWTPALCEIRNKRVNVHQSWAASHDCCYMAL